MENKLTHKNKIINIENGSIADELGLSSGDLLLSINQKKEIDVIDYMYFMADDYVEIEVLTTEGEHILFEIEKSFGEDIGLEFENSLMDCLKSCSNKCIFCFIDQLPKGMRETLYFKDDDSRMSLLKGNYISMTNMSDDDIDRIVEYKLSPIKVSVHTTNPELRAYMLNNRFASKIMDNLKRFDEAGIEVDTQIVVIPGINDGKELDRTLNDLYSLKNSVRSVAVVPVGITKYRQDLPELKMFDKESSEKLIGQIQNFQQKSLKDRGTRFVFIADEFYWLAGMEVPDEDAYEGYPQLENGIGLVRSFKNEVLNRLKEEDINLSSGRVTMITGVMATRLMRELREKINEKFPNLEIDIQTVYNDFFGHSITVAGLLTGQDIINQIDPSDHIMIPEVMLKEDMPIFLDGMEVSEIADKYKVPVHISPVDGDIFIDILKEEIL